MARVAPKPEVAGYCAAQWPDFTPPLTALLSGHVLDLDKLSEMLGEIGLRLNELIAIITSPDIFRQVDPAIAQFVTAVAALEDYLRDAPGRHRCDRT
jgi:hypothetical protein